MIEVCWGCTEKWEYSILNHLQGVMSSGRMAHSHLTQYCFGNTSSYLLENSYWVVLLCQVVIKCVDAIW